MRVSSFATVSSCSIFTALTAACIAPSEPALGSGSMTSNDKPVGITAVWAVPSYHSVDNNQGDYFDRYAIYFTTDRFTGPLHCSDRSDLTSTYEFTLVGPPGATYNQDPPQLPLGEVPVVSVEQIPEPRPTIPEPRPTNGFAYFGYNGGEPTMNTGAVTTTAFDGKTFRAEFSAGGDDAGWIVWLKGSFEAPICPR